MPPAETHTRRRVLVAVDDSPASRRAAAFVDGFFRSDDISIVAVNVARVPLEWMPAVPFGGVYAWQPGSVVGDDGAIVDDAAAREAAEAEAIASSYAPRDAEVEVVFGEPVDAIGRAAADENADLIVVGANDRGFLQRLFTSPVSERLARSSSIPVLVVP